MPTAAAVSPLSTLTCAPVSKKKELSELPPVCVTVVFAKSDSHTDGAAGLSARLSKSSNDGVNAGGPPTLFVVVSATRPYTAGSMVLLIGTKSTFGLL